MLQAIDFFQKFADRCHHGKEEHHLFPALEVRGFSRERGPTGVLLCEHEHGRQHLLAMARAVEKAIAGDREAVQRFAAQARAYVALLRQHIDKEDQCLFPMADEVLSDQDQLRLLESFGKVESGEMGAGTHEKYLRIADELAEHWGVPCASNGAAQTHPCCACGHQGRH